MADDSEKISAARKAAIILASLNREDAVGIMRNLSPKCVELVSAEIRCLGEVEQNVQRQVFDEVSARMELGVGASGGEELARSLLTDVMGDRQKADSVLENVAGTQAFSAILSVPGKDLAPILAKEQPSTVAIVLSFLPAQKSAEIVAEFELDLRKDIVHRLSNKPNADPAMVRRIERIFVDKVIAIMHTSKGNGDQSAGGPQFIADMFQHIDGTIQEELFDHLQDVSGELADDIRERMFTFDDIRHLSDQDMQKVMREVPIASLTVALRGADEAVFEKIAGNLSKRARENLSEEMSMMGKMKRSEVEAEQRNVVAAIRALEASGEISLSKDEDDAYL